MFKLAASFNNLFNKNSNDKDTEISLSSDSELPNAGCLDAPNAINATKTAWLVQDLESKKVVRLLLL